MLILSKIFKSYYVFNILPTYFLKIFLNNNNTNFAFAISNSPPLIIFAKELIKAKNLWTNYLKSKIILISLSIVLKFNHQVSISKAKIMHLLIWKIFGIFIPKLNNTYSIASVSYIVIGKAFKKVLKVNKKSQKGAIITQLQQYLSF